MNQCRINHANVLHIERANEAKKRKETTTSKHVIHEAMKNNTFSQKVVSYLIKKPTLSKLDKTFLFNKLEL
eukprot:10045201-Ditylum_brightwellii.AAC.1